MGGCVSMPAALAVGDHALDFVGKRSVCTEESGVVFKPFTPPSKD